METSLSELEKRVKVLEAQIESIASVLSRYGTANIEGNQDISLIDRVDILEKVLQSKGIME